VHYRYLQQTLDEAWLHNQARLRLPKNARRDRERVDAEASKLRNEVMELNERLAKLCGLSSATWQARAARIENRVERMAASVNERRWERFETELTKLDVEPVLDRPPWWNVAANLPDALRALGTPEEVAWEPVIVKEQVDYHLVVENLPTRVAEEIRGHADRFPGVRVIDVPRRTYPGGMLAANVLGHLGPSEKTNASHPTPETTSTVGVLGLERVLEPRLAGQPGKAVEHTDRRGQLISTTPVEPARDGNDIPLTLDPDCQHAAEALLDRALARNRHARGGAIVLLDVKNGDVLALASAPRFDPTAFALADSEAIGRTLTDRGQPMFDRATRMALPPGALAKPFVALGMLESKRVPAHAPFHCDGYLRDPEGLRCAIYRQQGVGHGEMTLADALTRNCNVYFAHYGNILGADLLSHAVARFGFGRATGIELSAEAKGLLPLPLASADDAAPRYRTGEAQLLAIGQGSITVTPLQMARAMAMLASGGSLVTPRLVRASDPSTGATESIGANSSTLFLLREALRRAVADEDGAAHDALWMEGISIAGLAATGEVAGELADHAWCAGYLPANAPRLAFAIAIEHGGDGARAAAPAAKRLIQRLGQLGWFESQLVTSAER
jgi:penicillin-binding protein 2